MTLNEEIEQAIMAATVYCDKMAIADCWEVDAVHYPLIAALKLPQALPRKLTRRIGRVQWCVSRDGDQLVFRPPLVDRHGRRRLCRRPV
jgi:hypothetical protein